MIPRDAIRTVYGTDVHSSDGHKIGSAGQVYLDNDSGEPAWVSVHTGLFGRKESFVPLRDATLTDGRLEVPFGKDQVKNAPRIDRNGELSPAEEDELYRYYGTAAHGRSDDSVAAAASAATHRAGDDDATSRSDRRPGRGTHAEPAGKARLRRYVDADEEPVAVPLTGDGRTEREKDGGPGPATG